MPVALVLLGGVTTEVTGFGYLDSLITPSLLPSVVTAKESSAILLSTKTTTTTNYLDSLQLRHNNPEGVVAAVATTTTTSPTTTDDAIAIASTDSWAETTIAETPDDHYAKVHPGAGWAGYKHPMYGGYLDNLAISSSSSSTKNNSSSSSNSSNSSSTNNNNDGTAPAAAATPDAPTSTTTSAFCVLEVGKKADYGDDIRWGAQVYLDNLPEIIK